MLGFIEVALSGLFFGTLPLLGKWTYAAGVSAGELLSLRFLGASLISFVGLAFWRRGQILIPLRAFAVCAFLGICGYALFSFLFFLALETLSASVAVLLLYQYPWIVALGAATFLGERVPRRQLVYFPLMILGLVLVIGFDYQVKSAMGLLFGFGAALFYSAYILVARRFLAGVDPFLGVAWIQLFAGVTLALIHLHDPSRVIHAVDVAGSLILFVIIVPTILAMSLFISGLQKTKVWEASVLSTLEPLTAMVLSMTLLHESFLPLQIVGGVLLLLCLVGLGLSERLK